MSETDRLRTPPAIPVQNLVKTVLDMRYNSDTHFVRKITPCHEFLHIAGFLPLNGQLKISAGKLKQPGLPFNPGV
ncbi:hypothetical protein BOM23_23695 [Erwinia sp. OLMDLW33]|nr:hypothetical protein BOM23_23695 [Erwinia sp. OLMDLW33]